MEPAQPVDLDSGGEAIHYLRKILWIVLMQTAAMTLISLICCGFGSFKPLLGHPVVLVASIVTTIAFFVEMVLWPEIRTQTPRN